MKFVYDSSNQFGSDIALDAKEIKRIFKLSKLKKSDIFCDLGSGNGEIVRQAIIQKKVKKSIGVEDDYLRFLGSVVDTMSLLKKKQSERIEFFRGDFSEINFSEATVVYDGLSESKETVKMFNDVFQKKRVRIIVGFPFVGYSYVDKDRSDKNPFFIMQTPLEEFRIDKEQWIKKVLGKKGTIKDVYKYYSRLLQELEPKDRKSFMKDLSGLVKIRF